MDSGLLHVSRRTMGIYFATFFVRTLQPRRCTSFSYLSECECHGDMSFGTHERALLTLCLYQRARFLKGKKDGEWEKREAVKLSEGAVNRRLPELECDAFNLSGNGTLLALDTLVCFLPLCTKYSHAKLTSLVACSAVNPCRHSILTVLGKNKIAIKCTSLVACISSCCMTSVHSRNRPAYTLRW